MNNNTIDNRIIGQNIAKIRKHKEIKAIEIANHLGISESAYTKYERGETEITISFISKVCNYFQVDPITIFESTPSSVIEKVYASNIAIQTNSNFSSINESMLNYFGTLSSAIMEQTKLLVALMPSTKQEKE